MIAVAALCGVLGLLVGSFLNVVIWRVPRGESVVRPPSACPRCHSPIRARDNVPVLSWLWLGGHCRDCGEPVSIRYPCVELSSAVLWALLAWHFGAGWQLPAFLYLAAVGLALAVIDLDVQKLPDALTLPSYVVGIVLLATAALAGHDAWSLIRALIGMAILYAFYLLLVVIYPKGMGWGDVKLAGVLGLYLGYLGWGPLLVGAFFGFFFGGVVGATLMAARKVGRKSKVPFGPFMLAGALLAIFYGNQLAHAYVSVSRN